MRIFVPVIAAAMLAFAAPSMAQTITNAGFESGSLTPWTCNLADPSGECDVIVAPGGCGATARTGTHLFCGYDNVAFGKVSQTLSTIAGARYTVSAYFNGSQAVNVGSISLGSNSPVTCPITPGTYTLCSATFTATSASDSIVLGYSTQSGTGTVWIDDAAITLAGGTAAIPAISEWGLLAVGLMLALSAGVYLRRRVG